MHQSTNLFNDCYLFPSFKVRWGVSLQTDVHVLTNMFLFAIIWKWWAKLNFLFALLKLLLLIIPKCLSLGILVFKRCLSKFCLTCSHNHETISYTASYLNKGWQSKYTWFTHFIVKEKVKQVQLRKSKKPWDGNISKIDS